MIAKIPPKVAAGKGFGGLNDYIANGKGKEKCEYANVRNCFSVETATIEMQAVASQNVLSKDPVFHFILSWREGETPTPEDVDRAVDIAVRELNLETCQALYGLHKDTDNYHVHVSVNRIHPESYKAINPNHGWTKRGLERAARKIELALGLEVTRTGHLATVTENGEVINTPQDTPRTGVGARARDHEDRTGEKSAERMAQEIAGPVISRATSWAELHASLASVGCRFERKGSGGILWYGEIPVKASRVARDCSLSKLAERLGPYVPATASKQEREEERRGEGIEREREEPQREHAPDRDEVVRMARAEATPILREAESWHDLHVRLAAQGFRYDRKGSGAMLWCGGVVVKASEVGRDYALSKMEQRLGPFETSPLRSAEGNDAHHGEGRSADGHNRGDGERTGTTPPEAGGVFPSQTWDRYNAERKAYDGERKAALDALKKDHDKARATLREGQRAERQKLYESQDWRRRGGELNALRSGLAAEQAKARQNQLDDQAKERNKTARGFPRFPAYKAWLVEREEHEAYASWVSRWRTQQYVLPGTRGIEPGEKPADIRDFGWSAKQIDAGTWVTEYRREGEKNAAFVDTGTRIALQKWREDPCVLAGLQVAAAKWGSVRIDGNEDFRHRAAVIATRNHIRVTDADLQNVVQAERERMQREREGWRTSMEGKSAVRDLFAVYQEALGAERLRVTATRFLPDGGKTAFILDKKDGVTQGFTLDELEKRWPQMLRLADKGENIYYTPLSDKAHYLVVDDMTKETLDQLKKDGYAPAIVIQSSPGNYQAIIKTPKLESPYDRQCANAVVRELNLKYGDEKFSGAVHTHRAPGFPNCKEKYRREDGTFPAVEIVEVAGTACEQAMRDMGAVQEKYAAMEAERQKRLDEKLRQERMQTALGMNGPVPVMSTEQAYLIHHADVMQKFGNVPNPNYSAIDGMVACRLRMTGHSREAVVAAIETCGPDVAPGRAHVWRDYAERTAEFAFDTPQGEAQIHKNARYERIWRKLEGQDVSKMRDEYSRRSEGRGGR